MSYMTRVAYGVRVTEIPAAVAAELARLRAENARLLKMLDLSPRQAAPPAPGQAGFFDAPPGQVHKDSPSDAKVAFFRALFAARTDIYATRIENSRTGWKGWLPAVRGGWQRRIPHERRDYLPLTKDVLAAHLKGEVHVGVYPLLDGDRCWWLAAGGRCPRGPSRCRECRPRGMSRKSSLAVCWSHAMARSPKCAPKAAATRLVVPGSLSVSGKLSSVSKSGSRGDPAAWHSPRTIRWMAASIRRRPGPGLASKRRAAIRDQPGDGT